VIDASKNGHPHAEQPPHDADAERGLVGSCLLDSSLTVESRDVAPPTALFCPDRRTIYGVTIDMHDAGKSVDPITLAAELKQRRQFKAVGGAAALAELFGAVPTPKNCLYYARIVRDKSHLREALYATKDIAGAAERCDVDAMVEAVDRTQSLLRALRGESSSGLTYQAFTCDQLDGGDFELTYLVDGILVRNQPTILGGSKKTLKTSIGIDLAIALATGGHFLGYFPCPRAVRVAVMSGESGMATIQDVARRVCGAARVDLWRMDGIIWSPDLPRFGDPKHLAALEKFIREHRIEVLLIDPAYLAMPGAEAGNLILQGELLRSISEVCQRLGCTLVLLHHTKRGRITEQFAPFDLDDLAWAGFAEFARQWLLLSRRSLYVPGTGRHELWLSVGGSAGHGGLWGLDVEEGPYKGPATRYWRTKILNPDDVEQLERDGKEAAREAKSQRQAERDAEKVVNALAAMPDQQGTQKDIATRASRSAAAVGAAIALLLERGHVVETSIARGNSRTYAGYQLANGRDD
jgi:AAA domain/DnaB-like helicase N terminal domain